MDRHPSCFLLALLVGVLAAACSEDGGEGTDPIGEPTGPRIRFRIGAEGRPSSWLDVPFPSDLYRDDSGAVALPTLPFDGLSVETLQSALEGEDGFGVTTGVLLAVDGGWSPPEDLAALAAAGAVRLLDASGEDVLIDVAYDPRHKSLVALPARGIVLAQRARHQLVVTTALGLAASPDPGRFLHDVAQTGVPPTEIAGGTTFTTRDLVGPMQRVLDRYDAAQPPPLAITEVLTPEDGGIDRLLGTARREHIGLILHGSLVAPNHLTETPPGQGIFRKGPDGAPEARSEEPLPFTLVLPRGSLEDRPLVLYQHGVNDQRAAMFRVADSLAEAGAVVLGIELPLHGNRHPDAVDLVHNLTGQEGPDGFADSLGDLSGAFMFGVLVLDDSLPPYHPHIPRDGFRQGALDQSQALRAFLRGDLAPIREAHPSLAGLSLSGEAHLIGESLGAIVGGITAAIDPLVRSVSLVVGGGGLISELALNSPTYGRTIIPILAPELGFDYQAIDFGRLHPRFYAEAMLYQWALEPGDPLAYAPYVATAPRPGRPPPDILMLEAHADESVPNHATEALAAAYGLHWLPLANGEAPRYVSLEEASAPASGNVATPEGAATGILMRLDATHGLLHDVTGKRNYDPEFPPFARRARTDAEEVENPTEAALRVIVGFHLGPRDSDGRAVVNPP